MVVEVGVVDARGYRWWGRRLVVAGGVATAALVVTNVVRVRGRVTTATVMVCCASVGGGVSPAPPKPLPP